MERVGDANVQELGEYFVGVQKFVYRVSFDISINRQDADEIRKKILNIPYSEWKRRG